MLIDKNEIFKSEWVSVKDIHNLNLNYDTVLYLNQK